MTRRRLLRVAALAAAGLASFSLAGCGTPSAPKPESTAAPVAKPTTAPAAPPAGAAPVQSPSPAAQASPSPQARSGGLDLAALEREAKKEGGLTFYTSAAPDLVIHLNKAFEEKYGLKVDLVRAASGPLSTRFASEAGAGKIGADVLQTSDTVFYDDAVAKGWIANLSELPVPDEWTKQFWNGYYALSAIGLAGLSWNTGKASKADIPTKWTDTTNPRWKREIMMVDPRSAVYFLAWPELMREAFGDDFLRDLGKQELRIVPSAVPGVQQLAAGDATMMVPATHWSVNELIAQGAPVQHVVLEPATGIEQVLGVPAGSPHPNAGRLFLNFAMSRQGQELLVKGGGASPLPNITGSAAIPKSYKSPPIKEALAHQDQILSLLGIA